MEPCCCNCFAAVAGGRHTLRYARDMAQVGQAGLIGLRGMGNCRKRSCALYQLVRPF
ncbi:hypothetical protein XAP412_120015 [Xanthomonas phaseoli pv. phaseoli]|uniref:Uncharacterized protein n=1 Tax=Xanthomonas campestris pv. phaseoli TaxID=317013 RepID=A0ABY1TPL6_XANCH|nr:hypothetical protein XAP412_120015 [Xanthomonas phaseoli pv. phaseoli]SON77975.1 hypothetical protein XAP6984_160015 [Xanthomonas phaseoli pv. phaseoli]